MELIKSRQNPLSKHIRALDNKKYRDEKGQFFIEGTKIVEEAIREGAHIECILVSDAFDWDGFRQAKNIDDSEYNVILFEETLFNYVARTKTPQGLAAIINKNKFILDDMLSSEKLFIAILDGVQDPGNVGTIIRTLDSAGASGVIILNGCADPYGSKALRATMGSIFRVPIYEVFDEDRLFSYLIDINTHIMISHLDGDSLFNWEGDPNRVALVIGNEGRGVRDELLQYASSLVKIPMLGGAESLNASVAAGIIIYEVVRRKCKI